MPKQSVKVKFVKTERTICNMPVESGEICDVLPRPADSNGRIGVKLKRYLRYMDYVCFKLVCPRAIYTEHFLYKKTFVFQKVCQAMKY